VVEAAHEALLRKWPLLRSWLDAEREFLIGKQQLEQDLRDWQAAADKDKTDALLTGLKLTRAQAWLVEHPRRLKAREHEFVRISAEHADGQLTAAALEREKLRRATFAVVVNVPADMLEVAIGTVSTGETWTFSAVGEWSTGIVR
jgi:hypothetical protein